MNVFDEIRWRNKFDTFREFAHRLAELSTCKRAQCGAVTFPTDFSRVASIGYNGPAHGRSNASCTKEEGNCSCAHAEGNAAVKISGDIPLIMYCTTLPCPYCANMIINCRKIIAVVYDQPYRIEIGKYMLQEVDIICTSYSQLTASLIRQLITGIRA